MNTNSHILEKIHGIQNKRMTGLLKLEKEGSAITLYFCDGLMDAAASAIPQLQLGRILSGRGSLNTAAVSPVLEKARRKRTPFGKAAVAQKLLDSPELLEGVREQIVRTLIYALDNQFAPGPFKDEPVDLFTPARLDYDCLVLELARNNLKPFPLDPGRMIGLKNGQRLSHLPWYPQELSVLSCLKAPCTLQELAASTGIDYARLGKILCVFETLNIIKQVGVEPSESTAIVKREGFPFEHLTPQIANTDLNEKLETLHNPASFISEQFKTLKVRLGEAAAQAPLRIIAVSSPQTQDGKSLVTANLAASFAMEQNRRVVVVDCDLRNPSLHKFLGASLEPGLLGYLGNDTLRAYCYLRRLDKLYVMTAGGISPNPIEHLSNLRMKDLIEYLKTEFDVVILDCPPFGPISDAEVLARMADGMLMVVRCGRTNYGSIERAFRNFDRSKLVGLVFNDVKPMLFNTQYQYKYYHYKYSDTYPYYRGKPKERRTKTYLE